MHKNGNPQFTYALLNRLKSIRELEYRLFLKAPLINQSNLSNYKLNTDNRNSKKANTNIVVGVLALFLVNYNISMRDLNIK